MYGTFNKKTYIILTFELLKKYTDENHHISQQELVNLIKQEYGVECDRRTVKANIDYLNDMGYEISDNRGDYYLISRDFDDSELRLLIDAVLSSRTLSGHQAKGLIEKLKSLGNKYFDTKVSHVSNTQSIRRTDNKQVLFTVSQINDAIDKKRKIKFHYTTYGPDLKLKDRGKEYFINPYQMVNSNGHYYLVCNNDKYDDVGYFRIDKITDVEITDEKVKPAKSVKGLENGLDLPKHLAEHIYMFAGASVPVIMRTVPWMLDNVVDWFGRENISLLEHTDTDMKIKVTCNEQAMLYWALQYGKGVEILKPETLRDNVRDALKEILKKYE